MANKYQTLTEFYNSPFGQGQLARKNTEYYELYRKYRTLNKLKIQAMTEIEGSYYIHFKVPSESKEGYHYDVVIRFFTDNEKISKQSHLRNYYVQFFSNCPSFIYQYSYIYKEAGYLIEALYNKLDSDYIGMPPTKANPKLVMAYDKSLFCVIRYLLDMQYKYLDKKGPLSMKKVSSSRFFSRISDFKSIRLDQYILNEEKKLKKTLEKDAEKNKSREDSKKEKKTSTTKNKPSITVQKKITGKSKVVPKKKASKSTKRK